MAVETCPDGSTGRRGAEIIVSRLDTWVMCADDIVVTTS